MWRAALNLARNSPLITVGSLSLLKPINALNLKPRVEGISPPKFEGIWEPLSQSSSVSGLGMFRVFRAEGPIRTFQLRHFPEATLGFDCV